MRNLVQRVRGRRGTGPQGGMEEEEGEWKCGGKCPGIHHEELGWEG